VTYSGGVLRRSLSVLTALVALAAPAPRELHAGGGPTRATTAEDREARAAQLKASGELESAREALALYLELQEHYRSQGDRRRLGWALVRTAETRAKLWQQDPIAIDALAALDIAEEIGDHVLAGYALYNLGLLRWLLGDGEGALAVFRQSFAALERGGDETGSRLARFGEGMALVSLERYDEAAAIQRQLLERARASGSRGGECAALAQLADIAFARGAVDSAVRLFAEAIAIRRELPDEKNLANLLNRQSGALLQSGDLARADQHAMEALTIARRLGDRRGEGLARATRARLLLARRDLAAARREIERAIAILDEIASRASAAGDRASFRAANRDHFTTLIDILMAMSESGGGQRRVVEALQAVERARARSLRSLYPPGAPPVSDGTGLAAMELAEIQKTLLDARTLLLVYSLGPTRSYVFVVTPRHCRAVVLPPRSELDALARRFYDLTLAGRKRTARFETERVAIELSRTILGPIMELQQAERLLIVADGVLQYVPFAALPDPAGGSGPLIERQEIVLLPSATTLAALRRAPRKGSARGVAVYADPVFAPTDPRVTRGRGAAAALAPAASTPATAAGLSRLQVIPGSETFVRLPRTRGEAELLSRLVPGALVALDFTASRDHALREDLSRYSIVHFATHGLVDASRPERSGLVLSLVDAEGRAIAGLLGLADIQRLRLSADLVVLSACRTALGRDVWGEGLQGLARAFMLAGAQRVVSTLWSVPDEATAELVRRFYDNLLRHGEPPAAALRSAQRALRLDPRYREPLFWSGFVLQGEWR